MKYCGMCGDMIMVYKVLNGYDRLLKHLFAVDNNSITRGHDFNLKKPHFKTAIRQHFLDNRVVNNWKNLPFNVANATFINNFKNKLDKCSENRIMLGEKYKQFICFSPATFFLSVFRANCVRSVCLLSGAISGADLGPLYTPGVEHFVVIVSNVLSSKKVSSWVFGRVINTPLSYVSQWCKEYIVCFIWYVLTKR